MLRAGSPASEGPQGSVLRGVPVPAAAGAEPVGSAKMAIRILRWGDASRFGEPAGRPTLVLLHGLGDGADIWRPVLEAWPGQTPSAVALDLPGHGGSDRLAADGYRVETVARIVAAALQDLRLDRLVVIGHSVGAGVALRLAGRDWAQLLGTILIERNPEATAPADAAVAGHLDGLIAGAADLDRLIAFVRTQLPLADERTTRSVIAALARRSESGWHLPLDPAVKRLLDRSPDADEEWALLKAISGPVAIVRGQYSSFLPKPVAERMAAATRAPAPLETIVRAGHAILLEQPAALAASLARHVTRFGAGA